MHGVRHGNVWQDGSIMEGRQLLMLQRSENNIVCDEVQMSVFSFIFILNIIFFLLYEVMKGIKKFYLYLKLPYVSF